MKVRESQIPEDSGKPIYPNKPGKRREPSNYSDDEDSDDDDEDSEEDEEKRYAKAMVHFEDMGVTMSLFGIESIEKDIQFVEKPKAHWEYGIVINKGIEPSMKNPKVNVSGWYESEEVRDKRHEEILTVLENFGFKILKA